MLQGGPVMALPMQEGAGAVVADISGFENNGTIDGATWVRESSGLWVLDFDGTDDVVTCTLIPEVTVGGTYSYAVWVYSDDVSTTHTIIQNSNSGTDRNGLGIFINGIAIGYYDGGFTAKSGTFTTSTWTHVVGTNNAGTLALYLNGVAQVGTTAPTIRGGNANLFIGEADEGSQDFAGKLALIRIYNRALSAPEILNHYNQEKHYFGYADASSIYARLDNLRSLAVIR